MMQREICIASLFGERTLFVLGSFVLICLEQRQECTFECDLDPFMKDKIKITNKIKWNSTNSPPGSPEKNFTKYRALLQKGVPVSKNPGNQREQHELAK